MRGNIVHPKTIDIAARYLLHDPRGYVIVDAVVQDPDQLCRATYYRVVNDLREVHDLHHSLFVRENDRQ